MSDDFEREEQAFTEALRTSLEGEEFRPLDPDTVRPAARPRRGIGGPWLKGLAAAAAVVLAVGAAGFVLSRLGGQATSASAGSVPAYPAAGTAVPEDAQTAPVPGPSAPMSAVGGSSAERWATTSDSPLSPRMRATVAWLDDRFYVVGGYDRPACAKTECPSSSALRDGASYDPASGRWHRIADAPIGLADAHPVAVGGRLYFLREDDGAFVSYDPATDSWATLSPADSHGFLVAAGDRVIEVARSRSSVGVPIDRSYDPDAGSWSTLPADPLGTSDWREAVWVANRLVLTAAPVGDQPAHAASQVAELDLDTLTWREFPDRELGRRMTAVGGLVVWPWTGSGGAIYDPASSEWTTVPPLAKGQVEGGSLRGVVVADRVSVGHWLLDPVGRTWVQFPEPKQGTSLGVSVAGSPGGVFVFGGWTGKAYTRAAAYLPVP